MGENLEDMPNEVLESYFSCLDGKILFLDTLYRSAKKAEALTLCCVYIDGLAQNVYSAEAKQRQSKRYFVKALLEHGGEPQLSLIHLWSLAKALPGCGPLHASIVRAMESQNCDQLYTKEEVLVAASAVLTSEQLGILEESIWRGTVAAQAYQYFRNPLVHRVDAHDGIVLGGKHFYGFETLYPALRRIATYWKELHTTNS